MLARKRRAGKEEPSLNLERQTESSAFAWLEHYVLLFPFFTVPRERHGAMLGFYITQTSTSLDKGFLSSTRFLGPFKRHVHWLLTVRSKLKNKRLFSV